MKNFFAVFGFIIFVFSILGAIIPGWHFHAVFADDETTLKFHEKHAKQLRASISERSTKPTDEVD